MGGNPVSKDRFLRVYFIITFLVPILATVLVTLKSGFQTGLVSDQISGLAIVVVMAMVHSPTIAAGIVAAWQEGPGGIGRLFGQLKYWKFKAGWYSLAFLFFPLSITASVLVLSVSFRSFSPAVSLSLLPFASLLSALLEEIGWTGFATPRMLRRYSPLKTGILLGVIHLLWHLAADYWGSSAFFGDFYRYAAHILLWLVGLVVMRVLIVWIYTCTKSLVPGWFTHFSYTGGQLLLTSKLTAAETLWWNLIFVVVLVLSMAFLAATSRSFREYWKSGTGLVKEPREEI